MSRNNPKSDNKYNRTYRTPKPMLKSRVFMSYIRNFFMSVSKMFHAFTFKFRFATK